MTIEELAKLKRGDGLMWHGDVVTLDRVQSVVRDNGREVHLNLEFLGVLAGPTLPLHVAEIWEWDGSPKASKIAVGWVWREDWQWPHFGGNYLNVWRLIPKIQKESNPK